MAGSAIVGAAAIPVSIGIAVLLGWAGVTLGRRMARVSRIRVMLAVDAPRNGGELLVALRKAANDRSLRVYYPLLGGGFVDSHGEQAGPASRAGRLVIQVGESDQFGSTVLLDAARPRGRRGQARLMDLAAISGPALENARLRLSLQHQLSEVDAARSRIVRAFLSERIRLEGDLHDGTQASLYEARSRVRRAIPEVAGTAAAPLLESAMATLTGAIVELRRLVRGNFPAGLREIGLGSALYSGTSEFAMPVAIDDDLSANEIDETSATAAFYIVMDVLGAAVRARPAGVTVRVRKAQDTAQLSVGWAVGTPTIDREAEFDAGDAWVAARDRVEALGGTFEVIASETTINVKVGLPCAS